MPEWVVIALALLAAVTSALGIVIRQRATIEIPHEQGVSTTMFKTLFRLPLWWAGAAVAAAGFGFQALALTWGSLILVQPLLVSALLFALPMSARLAHRRVTGRDWVWALVLTFGLATFVSVAKVQPGNYRPPPVVWALATVICAAAVAICVVGGARTQGRNRALLIATAVGVLFGVLAVLTKISVQRLHEDGLWGMLTVPAPYLVIILGVAATLLQQSAFHAGALQTSVPTMLVLEPLVAVSLGVVVLGEKLAAGISIATATLLPIAVVAMVAATIALGRDEGAFEDELEAELVRRSGDSPSKLGAHPPVGQGDESRAN
jgi:drug/metabolite transporter (DMT)-like permease